jgi:large subunit ribosomal protein LP0
MPSAATLATKQKYFDKLIHLLSTTNDVLVACVDNVASKTLNDMRIALRGKATLLFGKNTMIRTALRMNADKVEHIDLLALLPAMKGNVGLIFVHNGDIAGIQDYIANHRVPAAATAGQTAPIDVHVPAGPCGLDPAQTTFFQALNIATKIVKGSIEIVNDVHLIKQGEKVQLSEQVLLQKLGVKPFTFGVDLRYVFQKGNLFAASVLALSDDDIVGFFMEAVRNVAAISRESGIPTEASLPHAISNAFKNVAALVADIDFDFEEVKDIKAFLKDPSAFAVAAAPAAAAGGAAAAAAAPPPAEEEEEEADFDLFG